MKKQVVIRVCGSDKTFVVKKAGDIHDIPGLKLVFHHFLWSKACAWLIFVGLRQVSD